MKKYTICLILILLCTTLLIYREAAIKNNNAMQSPLDENVRVLSAVSHDLVKQALIGIKYDLSTYGASTDTFHASEVRLSEKQSSTGNDQNVALVLERVLRDKTEEYKILYDFSWKSPDGQKEFDATFSIGFADPSTFCVRLVSMRLPEFIPFNRKFANENSPVALEEAVRECLVDNNGHIQRYSAPK